eukprot:TRINITY_DN4732_c0_g2_i1.p2 TRINITY_DN4732_c0_g2~~TRINITY_DN4732_c0_g2_i1.p2  ORF type:complete len:263 (+),score=24.62 TRINITY_DN4732_c0_g2_i1:162-950(+)
MLTAQFNLCALKKFIYEDIIYYFRGDRGQSLRELGEEIFADQMEGLTVAEAALAFPSVFNETIMGLTFSGLVNEADYFYLIYPMFSVVYDYPNITEIMLEVSKTPDLYVQTILNFLRNWDLSCAPDVPFVALASGQEMLRLIFGSERKNDIKDIIVELIVQSTKDFGFEDGMRAFLEAMVEGLEDAKASESLSAFLTQSEQDTMAGIISVALRSASWDTDADALSPVLAEFVTTVQYVLEVEGSQMFDILGDIFARILDQIQ